MGIPAASNDPKVTARMTNETSSPMSSGTLLGAAVAL